MKRSQNGFVLVSVLLITSIATFYAFSEIKGNQLQERIGGNQQKEMNARMMAEKGVFEAFDYIKQQQIAKVSSAIITNNIQANVSGAYFTLSTPQLDTSTTPPNINFISKGEVNGATAYLKAIVSVKPGGRNPKFGKAVVGCEGVTLSASGVIDSFNSTHGDYNQPYTDEHGNEVINKGELGDTATLVDGDNMGNITLSGDSPIKGSIEATGSFESSGSSFVTGNVSANKDITVSATHADGVTASVTQGLNAGNDVTLTNNAIISGDISAGNTFTGNKSDGDRTLVSGDVVTGSYGRSPVSAESCDDIGIAQQVTGYENLAGTGANVGSSATPSTDWIFTNDATKNNHGVEFSITETQAEHFNSDYVDGGSEPLKSSASALTNKSFLGEDNQTVHVFDEFKLTDQDIVIEGDVKILVTGDFNALNSSTIKVKKGSQLTMVVLGKIKTADGFRITEIDVPGESALATESPVEFYSAHSSVDSDDLAVEMNGRDLSATIHSVLGHVSLAATASLKGAIRGKSVSVGGGNGGDNTLTTGVHFDEKFLDDPDGPTEYDAETQYTSVFDYYP